MERLHRLRIRIRRARQFADLAVALDPRHEPRFSSALVRLQKELGDLHDLDMVLSGLDDDMQKTAWADALRKERRRRRKEVLETLESPTGIPAQDRKRGT
jgi:CHAD domain-containing protein